MGEATTILAILALGGQLVNIYLHLRIRTAVLEQDKQQRKECDTRHEHYVLKETCNATHFGRHAQY